MRSVLFATIGLVVGAAAAGGGIYAWQFQQAQDAQRIVLEYVQNAHAIERSFYQKLPIYQDYATPAREAELRRYLLADHLRAARKLGIRPIERDRELELHVEAGRLVSVPNTAETLYFYFNVPGKYRYLTPGARDGLELLGRRVQAVLARRGEFPPVKIAVSSALRPASYQERLRGENANASSVSSHSYGVSFDVFYDEFYVALPQPSQENARAAEILQELRPRLGFLQGQAMRRQFQAALMEALLELQREGELYAILEKSQRCYHVTVLR